MYRVDYCLKPFKLVYWLLSWLQLDRVWVEELGGLVESTGRHLKIRPCLIGHPVKVRLHKTLQKVLRGARKIKLAFLAEIFEKAKLYWRHWSPTPLLVRLGLKLKMILPIRVNGGRKSCINLDFLMQMLLCSVHPSI